MAIDDKTCMVCGKHHKYCANNARYNKDETWRNLYCSEECRKIFGIYKELKSGKISPEQAAPGILKIGIGTIANINEPMKSVLMNVAKKIKPTTKNPAPVEEKQSQPRVQNKTNNGNRNTSTNKKRNNAKTRNN